MDEPYGRLAFPAVSWHRCCWGVRVKLRESRCRALRLPVWSNRVANSGKNPTVSILTPTYNVAPYLADAIASVLAQTVPDFEMLIVDDGSTDATFSIAESHA